MKELKVCGKGSYTDFDQYIASRKIGVPKKRIIKETLPFKNGSYDFTYVNGEPTYDDNTITYTFDIVGVNMNDVERQKRQMLDWLMNVHDEDIYDDYAEGYHFHGSYETCDWSEGWEQCQLSVTFSVYPFMIANEKTITTILVTDTSESFDIINDSSHEISPIIMSDVAVNLSNGVNSYSLQVGVNNNKNLMLKRGANMFTVDKTCNLTFELVKEVL